MTVMMIIIHESWGKNAVKCDSLNPGGGSRERTDERQKWVSEKRRSGAFFGVINGGTHGTEIRR